MIGGARLYERATTAARELHPLWHMDDGQALFAGPLGYNSSHKHSVPVYIAGIYGSFGLRIDKGKWLSCRTAVIPAGITYEFDVGGDPLAVFYIEPTIASAKTLMSLVRNTREENGALVGSAGEVLLMRELYEDSTSASWAGSVLDDLLLFAKHRVPRDIDPRISCSIKKMYECYGDLAPVAEVAGAAGLSTSRFQHLFTQTVGVPFRRFRAWCRMRAAICEVLNGSNFTKAAHAAGFADQPHFARDFRRTFGAPASRSLLKVRRGP